MERQRRAWTWRQYLAALVVGGIYLAIAGLSLMPHDLQFQLTTGADKLDHLLAYLVVMAAAGALVQRLPYLIGLAAATIGYAGILEISQYLVPSRDVSTADFLASTLGVVLGTAFAALKFLVSKRMPAAAAAAHRAEDQKLH